MKRKKKNTKSSLFPFLIGTIVIAVCIVMGFMVFRDESIIRKTNAAQEAKKTAAAKKKEEEAESALVKNSNHIKKADQYAYDSLTISQYIRPKNSPGHVENESDKKIAFLTFDDGPNHEITPQVLDILKEKQVPATFFVVGKNIGSETKDVLERILKEGHAIGIHSYSHDYEKLYPQRYGDADVIVREAEQTIQALQEQLGQDFNVGPWRYPGGHMSWKELNEADQRLKEKGIHWVDWNSLCGDAEPKNVRPTTSDGMVEYADTSLQYFHEKNVVVILLHDANGKQLTVEALPKIIDHFKEQGYEFGILK